MRFAYDVVRQEKNAIWIEDLSPAIGGMSITNAAEEVIQDLLKKNLISHGVRVYYTDTMGSIDELCHDGRAFIGFGT